MKRYLTLMVIITLVLGLNLAGCTNVQPNAPQPPAPRPELGKTGQLPEAEAGREDVLGAEKRVVLGFYTDPEGPVPGSKDSTLKHINALDEVAFFWYTFDGTGKVKRSGKVDLSVKDAVQKNNAKAYALVHNMTGRQFDPEVAHKVLANAGVRAAFVRNLVNLTTTENWDGIAIDIEKTPPADRNNFSAFLAELAKALKAKNKILNVSIPAKTHDYPADLWSGAYDYTAIGKAADQVILMTYDEHGLGTTQGPIASHDWVDRVISFATGKIPREKMVMGLPVYAFDWGSNKPTLPDYLSYAQALERAKTHGVSPMYDEGEQVPHFTYTTSGVRHEVFLENAKSLGVKLDYAKKYKMHGVAIWRLGMEDPSLWDQVLRTYGTNKNKTR